MRAALAQINPTVGDLEGNAALILRTTIEARAAGADLVVFPELALTGYPIEDLALRPSFQRASKDAIAHLSRELAASGCGDVTVLVGFLDSDDAVHPDELGRPRGGARNAAAVIRNGVIESVYTKHHLPNYGVFDEARYFVPGSTPVIIDVAGLRVCIAICEDIWREGGPVTWARDARADVLAVLNASPFEMSKDDARLDLCVRRAEQADATLLYTNLVGGQDELVFDGDSLAVSASGVLLHRGPQFKEYLGLVDIPSPAPPTTNHFSERMSDHQEVWSALVLGLRDYVNKNGFPSVIMGLSGGIDSAVVAALSCDALGPDRVFGVALPSIYSSEHSLADARDLAERCGIGFRVIPIEPMVNAFHEQLSLTGLAAENLQARVRGTTLMALSNSEGHLVLATGNKSELSVGYSTIYGDAVGGFAPIKDVPKTLVWELARWRNDQAAKDGTSAPIPPNSISKPPSAELRPGQLDSDSLPDYALLDAIVEGYVHGDRTVAELTAEGLPAADVERILLLTDRAEYKRRQYPPGTKIGSRAFGRDRRLPITNRWREHLQ